METTNATRQQYRADMRRLHDAIELGRKVRAGEMRSADAEELFRRMIVPGLYEHWKSENSNPKFYAVLGAVPDVDWKEMPVVVCAPLYRPHGGNLTSKQLLDPDDGFLAPIDRKDEQWNYKGPRFVLHQRLPITGLAFLIQHAGDIARCPTRGNVLKYIRDRFSK